MRIIGALLLFAFWLLLSDSYDLAHLGAGAVFASLVMWLQPVGVKQTRKLSWLKSLAYLPWLTVRIFKSGFHVCRLILSPSLPISPQMIQYETKLTSDGELVVLGNSITLTPGTITVEIEPGKLIVHAIDEASGADVSDGVFDDKIGRMFTRIEGK